MLKKVESNDENLQVASKVLIFSSEFLSAISFKIPESSSFYA